MYAYAIFLLVSRLHFSSCWASDYSQTLGPEYIFRTFFFSVRSLHVCTNVYFDCYFRSLNTLCFGQGEARRSVQERTIEDDVVFTNDGNAAIDDSSSSLTLLIIPFKFSTIESSSWQITRVKLSRRPSHYLQMVWKYNTFFSNLLPGIFRIELKPWDTKFDKSDIFPDGDLDSFVFVLVTGDFSSSLLVACIRKWTPRRRHHEQ